MNRSGLILILEVVVQDSPEIGEVGAFSHMQTQAFSLADSALSRLNEPYPIVHNDCGGDMPHHKTGTANVRQRIQIFLGGKAMVNPGHGLVDNMTDGFGTQKLIDKLKDSAHFIGRSLLVGYQSAIGKALMRPERITVHIGRQHRTDVALVQDDKGEVGKTVVMIVHIIAVEEKSALLRTCHKPVPLLSHITGVSLYFEHAIYLR